MSALDEADERAIVEAIARAEQGHRGEIRVHLGLRSEGDVLRRAEETFHRLGLDKTREGTAVLLYVAPSARRAAIYAGPGIYGAREPRYWQRIIDTLAIEARTGALGRGIVKAVELVGEVLRATMPSTDPAGNELPDAVTRDAV